MISIIMPAYNVEKYVAQAINSILNQTFKDFELIIINDCSTDNTEQIIKDIIKNDYRAKLIKTEHNCGVGASRCEGYRIATGEYIFCADADDWYDLDYLQLMYDAAMKNNAEMVSSGTTIFDEKGNVIIEETPEGVYEGDEKLKTLWANGKVTYTCNKLIKRSLYEKVPMKPRRYIEDTPVTIPQIFYANKVAVINSNGFHHRINQTSICHTVTPLQDFLYRTLSWCELVDFFLKEDPRYIENSNLLSTVGQNIQLLNCMPVSKEEFEKYIDLYAIVMYKMFRYVKITQIEFKI